MQQTLDAVSGYGAQVQNAIVSGLQSIMSGSQQDVEAMWEASMLPALQRANMDQKQIDQIYELVKGVAEAKAKGG